MQPLTDRVPIINPDGTPTQYFIRLLQDRGIIVDEKPDEEVVQEMIDASFQERDINTVSPIIGGGSLGSDLTLEHDISGVTPGVYGTSTKVPKITVNDKGHLTDVEEVDIVGGGGGGGWTLISSWNYSTPIPSQILSGVAGYSEFFIQINSVSISVSGRVGVQLSTDGITFTTSYQNLSDTGVIGTVGGTTIGLWSSDTTAARSGAIRFMSNISTLPKIGVFVNRTTQLPIYYSSSVPISDIRIAPSNGGNLTGGSVVVYGR